VSFLLFYSFIVIYLASICGSVTVAFIVLVYEVSPLDVPHIVIISSSNILSSPAICLAAFISFPIALKFAFKGFSLETV